ncbi:hypothetical protein ACM26V_14715 [Salipaludibacillus sp. HK11]|uniref:hypothetical protein n=1 Tax=Salipaludibacillus sp. HK11 TaxID=3394320 RepID=UPI0039FC88C9
MKKVLGVVLLLLLFMLSELYFYGDEEISTLNDYEENVIEVSDPTELANEPVITDNLSFTAVEIEGCSQENIYLEEKEFQYYSYTCETEEQLIHLGNELVTGLTADGTIFLTEEAEEDYDEVLLDYGFTDKEEVLIWYDVDENTLVDSYDMSVPNFLEDYQIDREQHEKNWDHFIKLIPREYRLSVVDYTVFAHDYTLGYVEQFTYEDDLPTDWGFAMNVIDIESETERSATIIHEFAHLLTLGEDQVTPYVSEKSCQFLLLDEGCTQSDSYIQVFFDKFWVDIRDEVNSLASDPDMLYDYYLDNEDNFVNDYAASSLEEDIAESFTYFVLQLFPDNTNRVQDEKISFFYDYPELVELRIEILSRLQSIMA